MKAYDLWNEPNLDGYWRGTAAQYRELILKPAIPKVHQTDPSAWVVAPSTASPNNTLVMDSWVREPSGSLIPGIDVYSTHLPYADVDTQIAVLNQMNAWCNGASLCLGFFITEFGQETGSQINQVLSRCESPHPGQGQFALLASDGRVKNRFCAVEQHNTLRQIVPCPCSGPTSLCAGIP